VVVHLDLNTENAYFHFVQATLTELQRHPRKVMRPLHSGKSVVITEHGRPIARIIPEYETRTISMEEFRSAIRSGEISDQAIVDAVKESRE
jgi:prevent-host-death family protein